MMEEQELAPVQLWWPMTHSCGLGELLQAAGLARARTLAFHSSGTVLLYKLLAISSSCEDITTRPLRAFSKSFSV